MRALLVVVAVELASIVALALVLLVDVLTAPAAFFGTALALVVLALLVAGWLGAVLVGIRRGRAWVRAATVVYQVLQFAIGVGAFQGAFAQPAWGWPLVGVAIVGFVLAVSKSAAAWLSSRDEAA